MVVRPRQTCSSAPRRHLAVVVSLFMSLTACGGEETVTAEELEPKIVSMCAAVAAVPAPAADDVAAQLEAFADRLTAIETTISTLPAIQGRSEANINGGLDALDRTRASAKMLASSVRSEPQGAISSPQGATALLGVYRELDTVVTALGFRPGSTFGEVLRDEPSCDFVVAMADVADEGEPLAFRTFLAR